MTRFPRWKPATAAPQSAIKDEKGVGIANEQRESLISIHADMPFRKRSCAPGLRSSFAAEMRFL